MDHKLSTDLIRPARPTDDYVVAIDLIGRVIARQGALIAAERARPRADLTKIGALQASRADAVQTALHLTSNDPSGLRSAIAHYTVSWRTLNSRQRQAGAAAS
jgi:sRNA-binding protein